MSQEDSGTFSAWIITGIGAIITTLAAVVTYLFRKQEYDNAQAIVKLEASNAALAVKADECEKVRGELSEKCCVFENEIKWLKEKVCSIDKDGTQFSHQLDHKP